MRSLLILVLVASGLVACAPKHGGRPVTAVRATTPIARLNARGIPNEAWSEADLNSYELDLLSLEVKDDGTNRAVIKSRREALDQAREKKVSRAFKSMQAASADAAAKALMRERRDLVRDVNAAGAPDRSWTTEKLMAFKRKLGRIDDIGQFLRVKLGLCVVDYKDFTTAAREPLNKVLGQRLRTMPIHQVSGNHLM